MGDSGDWDESYTPGAPSYNAPIFNEPQSEGRSFGKGRGFAPQGLKMDDNWSQNNNERGDRRGGRGGFRGGGRGGRGRNGDDNDRSYGGGGRSNNGGWADNNDDSNKNDSWNDNKGGDSWDRRGGGRGGGRGGRNFGGDDGEGQNESDEKQDRPPIYVPKERSEDELFEDAGICKGINFNDYKDIPIHVSGDNVPMHISSFVEANLRMVLMDNLKCTQYDEPTPIQKYAIPIVLNGRDLMASAQTGSGKTAAYLLPIIHKLLDQPNVDPYDGSGCRPSAVILSPTRELTTQIYEVGRKFARGSVVKVQQIYGGTSVGYQIRQVQSGCHILIATPGRLGDFLNRGVLNFSGVRFVVLDEADRMLDMGFRGDMETFLNHESMPVDRQTLLFSATLGEDVQRMASKYLREWIFISVGIVGGACKDVEQNFEEVERTQKKPKLKEVLDREEDVQGTLVFVGQKRNADFVASYLSGLKIPTTSIHGDRFQSQREEALRDFRSCRMKILVATSVAARGLDIKGVKHVINYDLPDSIDEYVHRIGRTGRLGNKGKATSFYDSSTDSNLVNDLVQILKQAEQPVPDFFSRDATGGGSYQDDKFGGQDYRSRNEGNEYKTDVLNLPVQIQDEEW